MKDNMEDIFYWLRQFEREQYPIYDINGIWIAVYTPDAVFDSIFSLKNSALSEIDKATKERHKKDIKINYNEHSKCPLCGSEELNLINDKMDDWLLDATFKCLDCKCTFCAFYTVDFAGIKCFKPDGGNFIYAQD